MRDFKSKKFFGVGSDEDFGFDGLGGGGLGEDFFDNAGGGPRGEGSGGEDAEGDIGGGFGAGKRKGEIIGFDHGERWEIFGLGIPSQGVFEEIGEEIAIRISGIGGDEGV